MFATLLGHAKEQHTAVPREGDLFKVIELHGKRFEIRYGYYEEQDRQRRNAEPMEIYPDFITNPQHTDDGTPFVTAMQVPCEHFEGKRSESNDCGDCLFYGYGDELLGICTCPKNKKIVEAKEIPRKDLMRKENATCLVG